jgi:hypothetical protein
LNLAASEARAKGGKRSVSPSGNGRDDNADERLRRLADINDELMHAGETSRSHRYPKPTLGAWLRRSSSLRRCNITTVQSIRVDQPLVRPIIKIECDKITYAGVGACRTKSDPNSSKIQLRRLMLT